ncbi:DUF6531 domain-containing protein [Dyella koreensis]|uniref:RHS repeat protein n=1 Tax=Dyella koreensis TaxID=311235 RepID=A0ABW8K6T7_9GAMM
MARKAKQSLSLDDCAPSLSRTLMERMTALIACIFLVLGASLAHAQDDPDPYTYTIAGGDGTVYAHADDACQAAYSDDVALIHQNTPGSSAYTVNILPYQSPIFNAANSNPPKLMYYACTTSYQLIYTANGHVEDLQFSHLIKGVQKDTPCPDGQIKNEFTGKCENPNEDQDRKEVGDPSDLPLGGVITCAGNPVSIASGNKFQVEKDFRDANGELAFERYYNGYSRAWTHSYGMTLAINGNTLLLTSDDGRSSIFTLTNGVPVGEPTEQGSLRQGNQQWIYTAADNTIYTFDAMGFLVRKQLADGRAQTITYTFQAPSKMKFTVTDSGGRTLQYVTSWYRGPLESLTTGGMTITYTTAGATYLITKAVKSWGDHTTTRSYVYEDANNLDLLTGIIDERGVRFATWHYDSQGRAISSEHANGAEKVSLAYQDDGSVVVTNALGHNVTYRYQVIQGIKRVTAIEGEPAAGCPASNSTYTYTARGQVETKTDALGTVTAYEYDTMGRETKRVEAKGTPQERTTTTTWDATRFLPLTVTMPDRVTTYTYDDLGRQLSTSVHAIKE